MFLPTAIYEYIPLPFPSTIRYCQTRSKWCMHVWHDFENEICTRPKRVQRAFHWLTLIFLCWIRDTQKRKRNLLINWHDLGILDHKSIFPNPEFSPFTGAQFANSILTCLNSTMPGHGITLLEYTINTPPFTHLEARESSLRISQDGEEG